MKLTSYELVENKSDEGAIEVSDTRRSKEREEYEQEWRSQFHTRRWSKRSRKVLPYKSSQEVELEVHTPYDPADMLNGIYESHLKTVYK